MNVLALDGALGAFSAAVADDSRVAAAQSEAGNIALERGLAIVGEVLHKARLQAAGIDRVAVGIGPGSFTGLRIAIAYAKALAAAWNRPLVPVNSFDLLEFGGEFERVLTVVVGRAGVISARFRANSHSRRASGRIDDVLDELLAGTNADRIDVVGAPKDVLDALAERGRVVRPLQPAVTPAAAALAAIAVLRTPLASPHSVQADYGELPAAKPPRS
ncbi:MAG: tRNA (adenosine(37)-N6)-threonylcarbamoyltransferase complex dimerization subunit type 1 TsaB [Candidatus Eremiobacteraeota bacterium]|nr:tRNA (adenosine(37)-N6)-threonylcarbamoyltransferase complex dimerization subunit type 1 TsaB [Candidatus Eremiobacteraeota bacterium]